ncbi:MAG: Hpt domain-containing protein [Desulfamplus sp.]|nr:Hpt domain-containing protein [Desulfamplus sp.]
MTQDNFIDHFRQEFFQEAREILENISDDILKLEADPENDELLNSVFRGIHTIKGSAGSFELGIISDFTHHLEGLLNSLRDKKISLSPDMVDVILSGSDEISSMIDMCANGETPELNNELIERIAACLEKESLDSQEKVQDKVDVEQDNSEILSNSKSTSSEPSSSESSASQSSSFEIKKGAIPDQFYDSFLQRSNNGDNIFKITLKYTSAHFENGYDPLVFLTNLYESSSLYNPVLENSNPVPPLNDFEPLHLYLDPIIYVATSMTSKEVYELVFDEELIYVEELLEHDSSQSTQSSKSAGSIEDVIRNSEAMSEFIEGSLDMLQTAEKAVMEYENSASASALDELFRVVHNIKGDSDLMGFKDLVTFTHAFESVLDLLRTNKLQRSQAVVELALQSVDFIKGAFADIEAQKTIRSHSQLYKQIRYYLDSNKTADNKHLSRINLQDTKHSNSKELNFNDSAVQPVFVAADKELHDVYIEEVLQFKAILIQWMDNLHVSDSKISLILLNSIKRTLKDIIKASATVGHKSLEQIASDAFSAVNLITVETHSRASLPIANTTQASKEPQEDKITDSINIVIDTMGELFGEPKKIGEILLESGKIKEEDLHSALEAQKPVGQILIESGKITKGDLDSALTKQKIISMMPTPKISSSAQQADEPQGIKTMRVDEHKVESFSNLVGEMLIARNTYSYLLSRLVSAQNQNETNEIIKDLKENLHLFARLTNDVQHGVVSLRMIPIKGIFQKFSRVVRDISRKQNKMINIMTDGEDIEIDKKVADVLSDPLVHLIRNSCDHGIETPVERKKAGKAEQGTILLKASREGSNIVIRINDDGRGINKAKLVEKAQKLGLNFSSVNDSGLMDIIFMPGLSTAEQITDVSGRGVGMDVVKTTIQSLGGSVSVMSEHGEGTQITLTIPTSMGIDTVLFVEAGGNSYAIPINYIMETIKVKPDKFIRAGEQLMFFYRGEVISVHFLDELLDSESLLNSDSNELLHDRRDMGNNDISMVIIKTARDKYGVIIDRFDKNMEIAVKPLPSMLSGLDVISGISILGDGRVLLVINPEQLAG